MSSNSGRHKGRISKKVSCSHCITYTTSTGVHYEYVLGDNKAAVDYATREAEAIGASFILSPETSVPSPLGYDESFKVLR